MKFLFLIIPFLSLLLHANLNPEYTPYIKKQLELMSKIQELNASTELINKTVAEQENTFVVALENMISNKSKYLKSDDKYDSKIYTLEKIIRVNKRAKNRYAVLRDEVKINSYTILKNQNEMVVEILKALDYSSSLDFKNILNDIVIKNQLSNEKFMVLDYQKYLALEVKSKTLKDAKNNIKEFYKLLEINSDVINYLYNYENRVYRLNTYENYNVLELVLFINKYEAVKIANSVLENYGFSVFKIILIAVLFLLIYFVRTIVYVTLEQYLLKIKRLAKYSTSILEKIRKPLEIIIILINVELSIYIYNDFLSDEDGTKFFNISYAIMIIWMFYRVINIIAMIKIHDISTVKDKILRNGVINVAIKIINFVIFIIGVLIVLKLAGVDLTAVLSGLGIGGIAVALASKDSLSNFFGTISVLLSDVFSQGDWIVVDGKEGVVVEIGLRVTTLRTFDNALIAIPNAVLANNEVKNWNKRKLGRRIKMSLGIKYDSSSQNIKNAVDEIRNMLDKHSGIATKNTAFTHSEINRAKLVSMDDANGVKKTLLVYLDTFSDSSINILVYCFTKTVDWEEWLQVKEDVMHKIMEIFEKNNLEFAFPSISLYSEK